MWEVVNALPPRCRDIYLLSRVEGMPQRRIAETYGISVKAVEKQITRALSTLRRELGEWGADTLLLRSEEHTSELQSLMRISYAVFCLKKKKDHHIDNR